MDANIIEIMPRPGIRFAPFRPGQFVVSRLSGFRVQVSAVSDCGQFFEGTFVGNRAHRVVPKPFQYWWNAWRVSSFVLEKGQHNATQH